VPQATAKAGRRRRRAQLKMQQQQPNAAASQRYTYRVLQTIQMKLILFCVWAEPAVLGSTKTAPKFKYEI
jgi:hypothetical protein